jgi:hypothetical protein
MRCFLPMFAAAMTVSRSALRAALGRAPGTPNRSGSGRQAFVIREDNYCGISCPTTRCRAFADREPRHRSGALKIQHGGKHIARSTPPGRMALLPPASGLGRNGI